MSPAFIANIERLFAATDLAGITPTSTRWQIISAFMRASDGRAERLIEKRNGVLFLISVPDRPNSGAVYIYDAPTRAFYMVSWPNRDTDLNASEFDELCRLYDLEGLAAKGCAVKTVLVPAKPAPLRMVSWEQRRRQKASL